MRDGSGAARCGAGRTGDTNRRTHSGAARRREGVRQRVYNHYVEARCPVFGISYSELPVFFVEKESVEKCLEKKICCGDFWVGNVYLL